MKCPIHNTPLEAITLKGVRVEKCSKDGGLFFDRDELTRAKDATDEDLRFLDFDLFEDRDEKYIKYDTDRKCPKDNSEMISFRYADSQVRIDKCTVCDGVWLEKGEFEKIIQHLENKLNTMSSKELGEETLKELADLTKGTDTIGQELKDFLTVLKLYEVRLEAEHPEAEKWIRRLVAYWPIH